MVVFVREKRVTVLLVLISVAVLFCDWYGLFDQIDQPTVIKTVLFLAAIAFSMKYETVMRALAAFGARPAPAVGAVPAAGVGGVGLGGAAAAGGGAVAVAGAAMPPFMLALQARVAAIVDRLMIANHYNDIDAENMDPAVANAILFKLVRYERGSETSETAGKMAEFFAAGYVGTDVKYLRRLIKDFRKEFK